MTNGMLDVIKSSLGGRVSSMSVLLDETMHT
jgi:hypothetical protein